MFRTQLAESDDSLEQADDGTSNFYTAPWESEDTRNTDMGQTEDIGLNFGEMDAWAPDPMAMPNPTTIAEEAAKAKAAIEGGIERAGKETVKVASAIGGEIKRVGEAALAVVASDAENEEVEEDFPDRSWNPRSPDRGLISPDRGQYRSTRAIFVTGRADTTRPAMVDYSDGYGQPDQLLVFTIPKTPPRHRPKKAD